MFCYKNRGKQLCRHGHRSIFKSYPNDPYKATSDSDEDYAQLTNVSCSMDAHYIQIGDQNWNRFFVAWKTATV